MGKFIGLVIGCLMWVGLGMLVPSPLVRTLCALAIIVLVVVYMYGYVKSKGAE
jgi:hypothetical protein